MLKAAEDADGDLVVRAYETAGRAARAAIELPLVGRTIEAEFGPAEIKTFRVPRASDADVVETDLLEWPDEPPSQPAAEEQPREAEAAPVGAPADTAPVEGPAVEPRHRRDER